MIYSFVEVKALIHVKKGVSMNDPYKTRRSFSPSLHIKPCGVRNESGKKCSSQQENAATCLLRSFLFKTCSTLDRFLLTEAWLPYVRACLF